MYAAFQIVVSRFPPSLIRDNTSTEHGHTEPFFIPTMF